MDGGYGDKINHEDSRREGEAAPPMETDGSSDEERPGCARQTARTKKKSRDADSLEEDWGSQQLARISPWSWYSVYRVEVDLFAGGGSVNVSDTKKKHYAKIAEKWEKERIDLQHEDMEKRKQWENFVVVSREARKTWSLPRRVFLSSLQEISRQVLDIRTAPDMA